MDDIPHRLYFSLKLQGVQKENDNTVNRYLFLYNNLNWYVFNIN